MARLSIIVATAIWMAGSALAQQPEMTLQKLYIDSQNPARRDTCISRNNNDLQFTDPNAGTVSLNSLKTGATISGTNSPTFAVNQDQGNAALEDSALWFFGGSATRGLTWNHTRQNWNLTGADLALDPGKYFRGALDASQLLDGTVPDARLSANVSLLGSSIESGEITDGTIIDSDVDAAAAIAETKLSLPSYRKKIGKVLWVGTNGDYTAIQAAINAASAGDTICIAPGTYAEQVTLKDRVNLIGSSTPVMDSSFNLVSGAIIQKNQSGSGPSGAVVRGTNVHCSLENLVVENTKNTYASHALNCDGGAVTAHNCIFKSGHADTVTFTAGDHIIGDSWIVGGYDVLSTYANLYLYDSTLITQLAGGDSEIWIGGSPTVRVQNCHFRNTSPETGFAVNIQTSSATLYFINNHLGTGIGHGIFYKGSYSPTIYAGDNIALSSYDWTVTPMYSSPISVWIAGISPNTGNNGVSVKMSDAATGDALYAKLQSGVEENPTGDFLQCDYDSTTKAKIDKDGNITAAGNLNVGGTISGNGTGLSGVEKPKAHIISVAKSGGDYATIQAAINAASAGETIYIAPGLYEEALTITSKSGLSLIGTAQEPSPSHGVRIKKDVSGDSVVKITDSQYVKFANLYIENTHTPQNSGQEATIELKDSSSNSSYFRGENLWLVGGQDCFYIEGYNTNDTQLHNCYVDGGVQEPVACNSGAVFTNCHFHNHTLTQNTMWVGFASNYAGEEVLCYSCRFTGAGGNTISCFTTDHDVLRLVNCVFDSSYGADGALLFESNNYTVTVYIDNCTFESAGTKNFYVSSNATVAIDKSSPLNISVEEITQTNPLINAYRHIIGEEGSGTGNDIYFKRKSSLIGASGAVAKVEVESGLAADTSDVILAKLTKTRGATEGPSGDFLQCDYDSTTKFKIDKDGNVTAAGTINGQTAVQVDGSAVWKDWAAAAIGQNVMPDVTLWDDRSAVQLRASKRVWVPNSLSDATYLRTSANGVVAEFPIPYNAGSILTRLRVKWQGGAANDGVKVRLAKRLESDSTPGFTTVGAEQTYIGANVTVSVYDFADETMAADTSYSIEVQSVVASREARLFSVGIETSKRVY
jgi:pectin methylesterase-like acyl-CoA thioesterase